MKTIRWKKKSTFLGRNGTFDCRGIEVEGYFHFPHMTPEDHEKNFPGELQRVIALYPVTGKGDRGRGRIEIPADFETVKELKQALDYIVAEIEIQAEEQAKGKAA